MATDSDKLNDDGERQELNGEGNDGDRNKDNDKD